MAEKPKPRNIQNTGKIIPLEFRLDHVSVKAAVSRVAVQTLRDHITTFNRAKRLDCGCFNTTSQGSASVRVICETVKLKMKL